MVRNELMTRSIIYEHRTDFNGAVPLNHGFAYRIDYQFVDGSMPQTSAYFHRTGSGIFDKPGDGMQRGARNHVLEILFKHGPEIAGADHVAIGVWGSGGARMLDLFKYDSPSGRPQKFVFRNGVYAPELAGASCPDGAVMLQMERGRRIRHPRLQPLRVRSYYLV